jgi:hypothetical protein
MRLRRPGPTLLTALALLLFFSLLVATWFVSHDFTLNTLDPWHDPQTNRIFAMDYLGNIKEW